MEKNSREKIVALVLLLLNIFQILLKVFDSVFSQDMPPYIHIILWVVIGAFALGYLLFCLISAVKVKNSISNRAIIAKSKKYIDHLFKLAKTNEKNIKRVAKVNDLKAIEKINKKVIKIVSTKKITLKKSKFETLQKELNLKIDTYQKKKKRNYEIFKNDKQIAKSSKYLTGENIYNITKEIIKTIEDLNRILLQVDQHRLRIKFGKFVAKYAEEPNTQIKAYIDYIGWTHILIGEVSKGFRSIMTGIALIDQRIGEGIEAPSGMSEAEFCELLFAKARAYRHLGTTYYTYTSNQIDPTEYLQKALEICNNPTFINHYKYKNFDDYQKLRLGVENNILLASYYKLIECTKKKTMGSTDCSFEGILAKVNNQLSEVNKMEKKDKHRIVKLLVLKNQIIMSNKYFNNKILGDINKNLDDIKAVLEENINFDDAMEVSIQQKIQSLYDQIFEIIKGEKIINC